MMLAEAADIRWDIRSLQVRFKKWSMPGVRLSSYGSTREVGRAREKRLSDTRRSRVLLNFSSALPTSQVHP